MHDQRPGPPGPRPSHPGHLPELDGVRGVAVLTVMIFHQTVLTPITRFDFEYIRIAQYLAGGVDLFFVLSGFLITGILYDSRGGGNYYRNFYARRALRIIPLYYALLFAALVVVPLIPNPKLAKWGPVIGLAQVPYWLFLSNWSIALSGRGPRHGMIDLSWTLSIEEQFYLTWPFVVRWLSRRRLMGVCLGLAGVSLAYRATVVVAGRPPLYAGMLTPGRMDGLALGGWVALAARGPEGLAPLVRPARWVAVAAAAVAVVQILVPRVNGPHGELVLTVLPSVLAVSFAAALVVAAGGPRGSWLRSLLRSRFLTTFGVFSYALYLFHYPIQAVLRDTVFRPVFFPTLFGSPMPGQLLFYVVATVPALAAAWVSWHLYEEPWLRLKRFFPATGRRAAGPVLVLSAEPPREGSLPPNR
jgi:peptidoglycan/LPS O-acetylase OafA/YrhL